MEFSSCPNLACTAMYKFYLSLPSHCLSLVVFEDSSSCKTVMCNCYFFALPPKLFMLKNPKCRYFPVKYHHFNPLSTTRFLAFFEGLMIFAKSILEILILCFAFTATALQKSFSGNEYAFGIIEIQAF
ncbi:hypothetical protein KIN20_021923 [Parelaphostrongylus tenuis]|uniref:Uncharacterized protein n=1 Tax=Parelaphostrongylus tenuis TaxID=148309 RepID=A0AAD5N8F6_PARTN|nr:hypothetical protein KIN20_021923 [Parelaphostrongylus tenuis]